MASINKISPGQILYSVEKTTMGNTKMTRNACFPVKVIEIGDDKTWVLASWNGNTPRKFFLSSVKKWKANKPKPKTETFGLPSY